MGDDPERDVREAVLNYMQRYPHASDTSEGIRRWWLPQPVANVEPGVLTRVLDELVGDGLMRRLQLPGGGVLYASRLPHGPAGN